MKKTLFVLAVCVIVIVIGLPQLEQGYHTIMNRPPILTLKLPSNNAHAAAPSTVTPSSSEYITLARQDARDAGINQDWFVKQISIESNWNPNAVSPKGAIGIAQFMPATARGLGIDPHDPVVSLQGAAQLMSRYVTKYGDYAKALAVYNAGPAALQSAITQGGDNWQAYLPAETQRYITAILSER